MLFVLCEFNILGLDVIGLDVIGLDVIGLDVVRYFINDALTAAFTSAFFFENLEPPTLFLDFLAK